MKFWFIFPHEYLFIFFWFVPIQAELQTPCSQPKTIDWSHAMDVLKNAHYSEKQIATIIKTLQESQQYGLTQADLEHDDQILKEAEFIYSYEEGTPTWKIIAGICVGVGVAAVIAAAYLVMKPYEQEKKIANQNKKMSFLNNAMKNQILDIGILTNNANQLHTLLAEDTMRTNKENQELYAKLRATCRTDKEVKELHAGLLNDGLTEQEIAEYVFDYNHSQASQQKSGTGITHSA